MMARLGPALAALLALALPIAAQLPPRDQGILLVAKQGQPLGQERFTLRADRAGVRLDLTLEYNVSGHSVRQQAELRLGPGGELRSYRWSEGPAAILVTYADHRLKAHYQQAKGRGSDYQYQMPPGTAILDEDIFSLWEVLADRYDRAKGGVQKFWVFVPHAGDPGQVALSEVKARGLPRGAWKLHAVTDQAALDLTLRAGRLLYAALPAAGVAIRRVASGSR